MMLTFEFNRFCQISQEIRISRGNRHGHVKHRKDPSRRLGGRGFRYLVSVSIGGRVWLWLCLYGVLFLGSTDRCEKCP